MLSGMKSQQSGLQMLGDAAQFAKDMKALIDMQQTLAAVKSMDSSNFEGFMKIRNSYGKRIGSSWRTQETDDYEFLRAAGVDVSSAEKLADARLKYADQLDKNREVIELEAQERWAGWGQNQLRNIGWQAMEKMGLGSEARRQQMQQEAYSQKGTVLTRQEAAIVDRLAYLQDKISRGSDMPNFSEQVHTNELASKGGFVGGVAVDNSDTPRKQLTIMQTMSRQVSGIASEVSRLYNALNNY